MTDKINNEDKVKNEHEPIVEYNPYLAAALAIIPGGGHFYVRSRLRAQVLLAFIPMFLMLLLWRLDVAGVDLGAILRGDLSIGDLSDKKTTKLYVTAVLIAVLSVPYIWSFWDAFNSALNRPKAAGLQFILLFVVGFAVGWDVTEINVHKAVSEVSDIVPRLTQLAWPWDEAFEQGEIFTEAGAEWSTPCNEDAPDPPEEIPGQPYVRIEPVCGDISGQAKPDGTRDWGTEISVVGRGFKPNEAAELWWRPESIPEFRPRAGGSTIVIMPDDNGAFRFTFNAPYFTIPSVATREVISDVIVRQTEVSGALRPTEELKLAASLMIETIYLGLMATLFGMVLAVPVSFLAARNLMSDNRVSMTIYAVTRGLLNIVRSIEPLIWAIIAAAWVGLGPFAGTIALTLHSIAALGKLYSEAIESIDSGPIEALESTGANRLQVIIYGVFPQVIPPFVSFTVYRWDINVRMSTIIGAVGGGGIGFVLIQWIRLNNFDAAGIAVWFIAIAVSTLDYISSQLRQRYV